MLHCSKSYDTLFNDGLKFKSQGNFEEARKSFEKAARQKETPEVYKEIANYYIEYTHDYDTAESWLQKSLKLNPNYPNSIHNMGLIYLKRYERSLDNSTNETDLNTANEWLKKNISINPDFGLSYAEYGMILFYKHNYNEALDNIKLAINKGANPNYAHLLIGKIYYNGFQNYTLAMENFNIAYNDFSKDSFLLKMMALTHHKLNHNDEAHMYYRKYIKSLEDSGAPENILQKARDEESRLISG